MRQFIFVTPESCQSRAAMAPPESSGGELPFYSLLMHQASFQFSKLLHEEEASPAWSHSHHRLLLNQEPQPQAIGHIETESFTHDFMLMLCFCKSFFTFACRRGCTAMFTQCNVSKTGPRREACSAQGGLSQDFIGSTCVPGSGIKIQVTKLCSLFID